jgi:hypothetical protein
MAQTNVKRKILQLLHDELISPNERHQLQSYYNSTSLAQVSKVSSDFFQDGKDLVYDSSYNIERVIKGPWENYDYFPKNRKKFKDETFPEERMLIWSNCRTQVNSQDLLPII